MSNPTFYALTALLCSAAADHRCALVPALTAAQNKPSPRTIVSLDGAWQIAEGGMAEPPTNFQRTVHVPGLVSLAVPPFDAPGPRVADRQKIPQKDPRRNAFWYRRTFVLDGPVPAVARLKVAKAMFGTRVFLNGTLLGDHPPCFTPGWFDARPALKTGGNEILVRVGADRDAVGRARPTASISRKSATSPASSIRWN